MLDPGIRQGSISHQSGQAAAASPPSSSATHTSPAPPPASELTCPFRTINYITHTLPKQCLTTSRSATSQSSKIPTTEEAPSAASDTHGSSVLVTITAGKAETTNSPLDKAVTSISASLVSTSTFSGDLDNHSSTTTEHPTEITKASSGSAQAVASEPTQDPEADADSPLDNANFLSFEEWRKQNLARAGQAGERIGHKKPASSGDETRRRPGMINNALDSLGDDSEIDLDFGGFVSPEEARKYPGVPPWRNDQKQRPADDDDESEGDHPVEAEPKGRKSNDEMGTTNSERFNYASFDCAATVLKTNPHCKGSTSILVENKDNYMLNECSESNKYFIVELCDHILVDTIVLANFEFFSSMFHTFRVSVSDKYPVKLDRWRELGTFEARNTREIQAFAVENPYIWARYLRIELLTHYGNEYYCPVSLFRVHGTTMIEEFRHQQEEVARSEEESEDVEDVPVVQEPGPEPVDKVDTGLNITAEIAPDAGPVEERDENDQGIRADVDLGSTPSGGKALQQLSQLFLPIVALDSSVCLSSQGPSPSAKQTLEAVAGPVSNEPALIVDQPLSRDRTTAAASAAGEHQSAAASKSKTSASADVSSVTSASSTTRSTPESSQEHPRVPSPSQAVNPHPTTQEGFFKTVHKRLQLLEANSTLSLQYIEEQSRILRDAFTKVEKRQLAKTTAFLEHLNSTVLSELRGFRQQYDEIWQSTVIELESQRERSQREVIAVSARLSILADELVSQKRLSVIQSTLLLLCIGVVLFSRSGAGAAASSYLDLPVVQSMLARSQSTLGRLPFESPLHSPGPTRPASAWQQDRKDYGRASPSPVRHGHRRGLSDDSEISLTGSSSHVDFSRPQTPTSVTTPTTRVAPSTNQQGTPTLADSNVHQSESPTPDALGNARYLHRRVDSPLHIQSSPATPSGTRTLGQSASGALDRWGSADFREEMEDLNSRDLRAMEEQRSRDSG